MNNTLKTYNFLVTIFILTCSHVASAFFASQIGYQCFATRSKLKSLSVRVSVWVEDAEDGFVDEDENLMVGEVCLKSIKAYATDPDNEGGRRFLGAAALVARPSSNICDCWIADSLLEETNLQLQGAMLLLDTLFFFHLERSNAKTVETMTSTFVIQSGTAESDCHCASYMAALNRGFKPLKDLTYDKNHAYAHLEHLDLEEENLDSLVFDIASGVERYSSNRSSTVAASIFEIIQRVQPKTMLDRHFE